MVGSTNTWKNLIKFLNTTRKKRERNHFLIVLIEDCDTKGHGKVMNKCSFLPVTFCALFAVQNCN